MSLSLPIIYPITDRRLSGLTHAAQVERMAEGGATLIQLRDKTASPGEFYHQALDAVRAARRLGVRIIVNDRVDIALAVGADGVHLGQSDLPVEKARTLVGSDRIIGFSTHNVEQALEACFAPVDYIAVGPVFRTATKEDPDPVVGLDIIREINRRTSKPVVAIGGITLDRARSVIAAGADSLALISDLYSTGDVTERVRDFFERLG